MLRSAVRLATRPLRSRSRRKAASGILNYDMFDGIRTTQEVAAARKLERIYHRGQDKAWEGKEVLTALIEKHGGVQIAPEKIEPLGRIFSVIFWGELAAWKVSAELALEITELEPKLAATSQAHDEARHFYVMHDYLTALGYQPGVLPEPATDLLERVISAPSLAKKLLGMQLMVEPVALTIFQLIRASKVEPVLCDLLPYYERDEARHVALGVQYLPKLLDRMSRAEIAELWIWQLRLFFVEIRGVHDLERDFRALGFHPREALRLGQTKQLQAIELMAERLGRDLPIVEAFRRIMEFRLEMEFPHDEDTQNFSARLGRAIMASTRSKPKANPEDHLMKPQTVKIDAL